MLYIQFILAVYLILSLTIKAEIFSRKKLELNVEILICTDYSIFKMHESIVSSNKWNHGTSQISSDMVINHIKAYYTEIIDQVNERYDASFKNDPDISIKISISQFYIAQRPDQSDWFNKYKFKSENNQVKINGDLSLIEFNTWLETNRDKFYEFDHAFGVTALDLTGSDRNADYNGLAYIYGICRKSFSGSIIEDRGAFESVRSFAHELAHNLGTDHDGSTSSIDCPEWDNYLMASKYLPYNQLNSWLLSNCSIRKIKEYLSDVQNNFCLLNHPNYLENTKPPIDKMYPGQIYDLYDQCKHLHGPNSTPCFEYQASFCQSLYCRRNETNSECVWIAPATEGSDCGNNGWCLKGKCEKKQQSVVEDKQSSKVLVKKQDDITEETGNVCVDLMDSEFCESAYLNDYCNELFYWNGKNIGSEWCKKMCKKC